MEAQQFSNEQHWRLLVLLLKKIAKNKGITHQDIADRTGLHRSNVTRAMSLNYCPRINTFLQIAKALKVNVFFEDQESNTDLNQIFEAAMNELGRRPEKLSSN